MAQNMTETEVELKLMKALSKHPGKTRAIGMGELYEAVYGKPYNNKINGTRQLRKVITKLREEGQPICSTSGKAGGGYFMASAGSDLQQYCDRLRNQALRKLALMAKLRKQTLPQLLGQIQMELKGES